MELHETIMGKRLLEHTLPEIARQLKRIADSLEKLQTEEKPLDINDLVTLERGVDNNQ